MIAHDKLTETSNSHMRLIII